jgi:hypothetical protein
MSFVMHKLGIRHAARFGAGGRKIDEQYYERIA